MGTADSTQDEHFDTPADHVRQYEAHRDAIRDNKALVSACLPSGQLSQDEHQVLAYRTSRRVYPVLTYQQFELIHAVLGLASELGEIADTVKKHVIYQQPLDASNIVEEQGDLDWYGALLMTAIGELRSIAMTKNITKLRKRYPEGYSDLAAIARADKVHGA